MVESFAATLSDDDDSRLALQDLSHYCGCEPIEEHCMFCPVEALQAEYFNVKMPFLDNEALGIKGTCELFYETQYQIPMSDPGCVERMIVSVNCGCKLLSSNQRQQAVFFWTHRGVAVFSLIASCCVLYDTLKDKTTRRSVYHQLVFAVAVFDVIASVMFIVGPAATDKMNHKYGVPWGIPGAEGNAATCKAAAFFSQLGVSSVFFSVSLTVYFYMMIVRGLREEGLRKLRPCFFGPPLLLGLGLAFASIPFGSVTLSSCNVSSDSDDHFWAFLVFALIPALSSALIILVFLIIIYLRVRGDNRQESGMCWAAVFSRSHRTNDSYDSNDLHSSSTGRRRLGRLVSPQQTQLEKRVFWQCLYYGVVFGITWPLWAWATIEITIHGFPGRTPFALWVLVSAIIALAGFNNAVCYFRYRIAHRLCHKSKRSAPPAQQPCEHSSTHPWKLFLARIAISSWFPNSALCDSSREEHLDAMNLRSIREDAQAAAAPNIMVSSLNTTREEEDGRECHGSESEATIEDCCGKPQSSLAVAQPQKQV